MSASKTTLRLLTVLFILAGILLLRKPVFGQTTIDATTHTSVIVDRVQTGKAALIISTRAQSEP